MRRAAALALVAACGAPPAPAPASLWTLAAFKDAPPPGIFSQPLFVPAGAKIPFLSPPYAPADTFQSAASDGLSIYPAFSEGRVAAYTVTEIWNHFPVVWLQPLYLPVTAFNGNGPVIDNYTPGALAVFSIDTTSRFYSPYWQIIYFLQPSGTEGTWTSAKQIQDANLTLFEGKGTFCTLGPANLAPVQASGAAAVPVRPITGEPVGKVLNRQGYVDGHMVNYVDFGRDRFQWDPATNVIKEAALFQFAARDKDGGRLPLDLPKVGGTGPLGAPNSCSGNPTDAHLTCPNTPNNRPQFGALWHEYTVLLPLAAGVYVPSTRPALRALLAKNVPQVAAPLPEAGFEAMHDDQYTLRVVLDAACFTNPQVPCVWLDSQAAIEQNLSQYAFADQDQLSSCPMLFFNGYQTP